MAVAPEPGLVAVTAGGGRHRRCDRARRGGRDPAALDAGPLRSDPARRLPRRRRPAPGRRATLLAAAAGTVAVCRSLRTSRRGTALAALALVALTVPVAWARGGEPRFSPEPPPSQVLHVATLTEYVHRPDPGLLPPRLVHPSPPAHPSPPPDATDVTARDDAGWWINPLDWDEVSDGVLTGVALAAFLALTAALLPPPRRPDLRP